MKCSYPGCGNKPRYIDEHGELACGVCPIKAGIDSIRISDVPKLVGWARDVARAARHPPIGHVELDPGDIAAVAELIRIDPPASRKLEPDSTLVPWPKTEPTRYLTNTPCDMWTGPCACGATHTEGR